MKDGVATYVVFELNFDPSFRNITVENTSSLGDLSEKLAILLRREPPIRTASHRGARANTNNAVEQYLLDPHVHLLLHSGSPVK